MIPHDAKNANGVDFEIRLNLNSSQNDSILKTDLNETIKAGSLRLKEHYHSEYQKISLQLMEVQERQEQSSELIAEKSEMVAALQLKLSKTEAQYKEEKEVYINSFNILLDFLVLYKMRNVLGF